MLLFSLCKKCKANNPETLRRMFLVFTLPVFSLPLAPLHSISNAPLRDTVLASISLLDSKAAVQWNDEVAAMVNDTTQESL